MKVSILHLSDTHFSNEKDGLFLKQKKIVDAIKNEIKGVDLLVIAVAGDISLTGNIEELNEAKRFFDELQTLLQDSLHEKQIQFVVIPGNHDCNLTGPQSIRNTLIEKIRSTPEAIDEELVTGCANVQNNFNCCFESYLSQGKSNCFGLVRTIFFEVHEKRIQFNCFNTAWISTKDEVQGKLYFPVSYAEPVRNYEKADLQVSMLHHPLNWIESCNAREFDIFLRDTSKIVLTGHEHQSDGYTRIGLDGEPTLYLLGGVLQDQNNNEHSSFNLVEFDLANESSRISKFAWIREKQAYTLEKEQKGQLPNSTRNTIKLSKDYLKLIDDPGIAFTHPNKSELVVSDYFVFPDLEDLKIKKKTFSTVEDTFSKNNTLPDKCIVFGEDSSGKTSFARQHQRETNLNHDKISILLNGEDLKKTDIESFRKVLKRSFLDQYEPSGDEYFNQIDENLVVIIIDDLHKSSLNIDYLSNLLAQVNNRYKNILIFCGSSWELELEINPTPHSVFIEYSQLKIKEMGHQKRDEIIEKWIKIGKIECISNSDLHHQKSQFAQTVNTTMGRNFIPKYPIFVLTILQAIEGGHSKLQGSSYGHYYQYLISFSLGQSNARQDELDFYFKLLGALAYYCFKSGIHELPESDLSKFYHNHCTMLKIIEEYNKTKTILLKSKLLSARHGSFRFTHNYIYYYFVAQHLSDNIKKPEIFGVVQDISKRLYRVEFANIIIFLVHHTNVEEIIGIIISEIEGLFKELSIMKLSIEEIRKINGLIVDEISVKIANKSADEHRKAILQGQDAIESSSSVIDDRHQATITEPLLELNIVGKLNLALKLIEISGHITKNYFGSIDGEYKHFLVDETFSLGMRALRSILENFETDTETLVSELLELSKDQGVDDSQVRKFVFQFASFLSFSFVNRCASSMASKKLKPSLDDVFSGNSNVSFKLIELAIDLSFVDGLVPDKIAKLYKELGKNHLAISVLKYLVISHLYLFDVDRQKRESVCKRIGIQTRGNVKILSAKDTN